MSSKGGPVDASSPAGKVSPGSSQSPGSRTTKVPTTTTTPTPTPTPSPNASTTPTATPNAQTPRPQAPETNTTTLNITGGSDTDSTDPKIKVGLVGTARPKTSLVASLLVASTILVVLLSGAAVLWWLLLLRSSPDDDSGFHGPSGGGDPGGENGSGGGSGWWDSVVRFVNSIPREVAIVAIVVLLLFSLYVAAGIAFIASPRLQAAFFAGSIFAFGPCEEGDEELKQANYAEQLPGLINFRMVKEDDGGPMISLGAWYVPPWLQPSHFSTQGLPTRIADLNLEADRRLVVLCAHGSAGTRAEPSRRKLYEVLARRLAYHVVAFEYRGNGDSSDGTAGAGPVRWTCPALAEDAFIAYSWLRVEKRVPPERILLWGHSLGTAVLVEMLTTRLSGTSGSGQGLGPPPLGAILEAALSSMVDVIREANFGPAINCARATVPLLQRTVLSVLARSPDFSFDSMAKVDRLPCPLLFLHATDDEEIEVELGRKLFDAVKERAPPAAKAKSRFQDFPSGGHMDIVLQYEEVVAEIVRRFVASLATSSA